MNFITKLELRGKNGSYTIPFTSETEAETEAAKYEEGGQVYSAQVTEWTSEDQAWWNEKKLTLVSSFGEDYLNDKNCLGMLKMFAPCIKKR